MLSEAEVGKVIRALDSLGLAMADANVPWTRDQRRFYGEAIRIMQREENAYAEPEIVA